MRVFIISIILIFTLNFSTAILSASEITLREIESELNQTKDLNITKLWKRLGLNPAQNATYFGCNLTKDKECVLEKESWKYKIFSSEWATKKYNGFKILQLSYWDYQLLIFQKEDKRWIYREHIDLPGQKVNPPEIKFYKTDNNPLLFSVEYLGTYGTGILGFYITFYRCIDGKIKPVLDLIKRGHVWGWPGLMFNRKFEAKLLPFSNKKGNEIGFVYSADYYSNTESYNSRYDLPENPDYRDPFLETLGIDIPKVKDFLLFSLKRKAYFIWDENKKEYKIDKQRSEFQTKDEIDAIFSADNIRFYKYYKKEIENLKKSGNKFQKEWVEKFFEEIKEEKKSVKEKR
ncbi:MAG: hypothetical protein LWW94_02410 [Candidatus Desulfofervidaceae bacterium]|nr:hypothetical protein [Candidatus Desulfofervidaceae bacterium]